MELERQPFVSYKEEEERNKDDRTFTTRLTSADREWFLPAKKFLKQPKNSTAMKQLAHIGAIVVLQDQKISKILEVVLGNDRKNKRIGVPDSEFDRLG